ncbi:MAG: acyl-CoA dehydrogenase family protein [Sphingorhabdus sp.]
MTQNDDTARMVLDQAVSLFADKADHAALRQRFEAKSASAMFDTPLWQAMAEVGWPAILAPEPYGLNMGADVLALICEQAGMTLASSPLIATALGAQLTATVAGQVGPAGQFAETLASGSAQACIVQPDAASLRYAAGCVDGRVAAAAFAATAHCALVRAIDDHGSPVLLAVDLGNESVERHCQRSIDARAVASLAFRQTPADVISTDGSAWDQLLGQAALLTAFEQIGGARACLDMACDYARTRMAFGQPIGQFQGVKHALADVYADIEIARGVAGAALAAMRKNAPNVAAAHAAARWSASQCYEQAAKVCVHVHGGLGVTWEGNPQLYYRRARALALELGPPHVWRDRLIGALRTCGVAEGLIIHE